MAMSAPLLEADDEHQLAVAWRHNNDERALNRLIRSYLRLVISIASRFRNYGLPMGDLIQEGNVGLMQAAARFEPDRGVRFSTYASWWIRSAIQDYVLRNWSIVRTGTTAAQKSLFFNLRRLRALIADVGDGRMNDDNCAFIASELRVSKQDVTHMASRLAAADRSLNAQIGDEGEGAQWQDMLADERDAPEAAIMFERDTQTHKSWIEAAFADLSDREVIIVRERRLSDEGATLESLGKRLGISKERVRQIEHQALKKMHKSISEHLDGEGPSSLFA
jgi:RNA polymerase sigma-32 factor